MTSDILIVDDEKDIRALIQGILEDEGYNVRQADGAKQAYEQMKTKIPDLVILDIWLQGSDRDGLEILNDIHAQHPMLPVLMISGHGTIETAVKAIKNGAYDFVEKPFKSDRLILMIQRALETARLKIENKALKIKTQMSDQFLGVSAYAQAMRQTIEKAANTNSRALITGEAGTGKNVIARAIHTQSPRKDKAFVSINCAELSEQNFDKEICGTALEGGYEGALMRASGGTIFFDEICDLSPALQSKLMKLLQDSTYAPIGVKDPKKLDARIIAATNQDIESKIQQSAFSGDLFHRMNVTSIQTHPLNRRQQDIPILADYFITQCAQQSDLKAITLSDPAKAYLQSMEWNGNARALKNTIERLLIKYAGQEAPITQEQLSAINSKQTSERGGVTREPANDYIGLALKDAREKFEKSYLQSQLNRFDGNISQTAKFVGMERSALHRKMKSLDIFAPDKQDEEAGESTPASGHQ